MVWDRRRCRHLCVAAELSLHAMHVLHALQQDPCRTARGVRTACAGSMLTQAE